MTIYTALIRTHHITSRRKISTLKSTAKKLDCYALLRSNGGPGLMYVEARTARSSQIWIDTVRELRYKDFQLVAGVRATDVAGDKDEAGRRETELVERGKYGVLEEVGSVREFAEVMDRRGLGVWWRNAMGFAPREK